MFGGAPVFDGGAVTCGAAGNGSPVVGTCCASSTLGTTRKAALQTTRKAALQTTCFKNCMTMDQNPSGWPGLFENLPFARQCLPRWPLPSIAEELCAYPRTTAGPLRLCKGKRQLELTQEPKEVHPPLGKSKRAELSALLVSRCSETPSGLRGPVQITRPMRPGGTVSNVNSFLPVAKEARADAGICGRTRQRARSASSKIRDIAKRGGSCAFPGC